nr:ATP-binding cassette domain-containing protein [Bacilli bacterium]
MIHLQNVTVMRQGKAILQDITWHNEHHHYAILGANGAGKTTLLQLIMGYLWPTQGSIRVLGHTLGKYDVRELRKEIGFVSSALDQRLDNTEEALNIVISGRHATHAMYHTITQAEREFAMHQLHRVGATNIATTRFGALSHGEKQKVLLARSLMAQAKMLILDEPCNGLDFPSREDLLDTIEAVAQSSDAPILLYVTHYPNEIVPSISHALLVKAGKVWNEGAKADVLTSQWLTSLYDRDVAVSFANGYPIVTSKRS